MFKKIKQELKKIEETPFSFSIDMDDDGYTDRECPSDTCLFQFKVLAEDWLNKVRDESVFCPLCGHNEPANHFWTSEQVNNAKRQLEGQIMNRVDKALKQDVRDFNRRQPKSGFINIKATYEGASSRSYIMPISAKKALEQKIECEECGVRYSVLGSAFFCPSCGSSSVDRMYSDSLKKIETKIKHVPAIRKTVKEISADEAELTVRSLIETGLSDGVVAFQRFCDEKFKKMNKSGTTVKFNAFQNLEIGAQYWLDLLGESYKDWLSDSEYRELVILFQKRHLLAHSEGIVDQKYIDKSFDTRYKIGQRIVVKEEDVLKMVSLIRRLTDVIKDMQSRE